MSTKPLVSVIIPTFQRSEYLVRAIESVMNQTYPNIEIIVVDDNDGNNKFRRDTQHNLNKYITDNKVIYVQHDRNKGLPAARNTGIRKCQGEFVAFLDDDDEWLPRKLEYQVNLFNKLDSTYGLVGCYWENINEFEGETKIRKLKFRGDLSKVLALNHFAPPSMVMVKKDYLEKVGGFDESFLWRQDIELYYRLSFISKFEFVEEVLVKYYQHPEAMSTNYEKKMIGVFNFIKKHHETIRRNKKPWAEINEHLAELYTLNGFKTKAFKRFLVSIINRPFYLKQYVKLLYSVFLSRSQYKTIRNFK